MTPIATCLRYARIARQYARMGLVRKSQFRIEFASQVIMDIIWYVAKIAIFEILFLYTEKLASWTIEEVRIFLGFVFVSDAFMMMWLMARWRFGRDLKDGKLDPFRVRPGATAFLYFFQQFSPEAVLNMSIALGYLVYGIVGAGVAGRPLTWLILPWAIILSWWTMTAMTIFFSTIEFHVLNSDLSMFLTHAFDPATTNPLDVFTARIRLFLLYIIPVGVMTHVPASMVLGRYDVLDGLLHTAWIAGFGLFAFALWTRGFRKYESAMS